tara:strand:+ start:1345 stop:1557 length:213 start_codon:yes stop_codon:yes gene_type:complete
MPRKQTRPVVEPIRRKCAKCGKIKLVVVREWKVPPTTFTPNMNNKRLRKDIPGAEVTNYCSYECSGQRDE